jgi:prepilin-type N-terminal cleavage/methylation domain-containing protein
MWKMGNKRGYTLVELLVVMAIFIIIIIIATKAFESIVRIAGHQTKTAASQIEGIVGLEMMRTDLAHAGYGLPWQFQLAPNAYNEVDGSPAANTGIAATTLNDVPPAVPRAIVAAATGVGGSVPGSHYLVIKSGLLALKSANSSVGRWGKLIYATGGGVNTSTINRINDISTDLRDGTAAAPNNVQDRVITIRSEFTNLGGENKVLVMSAAGNNFSYAVPNGFLPDAGFQPADEYQTLTAYGISDTALRMPYNRSDYYISRPPSNDPNFKIPDFCNSGTGVLFKAVADHAGGYGTNIYPLLNCTGDMRVVYYLDMDDDGNPQTYANAANGANFATSEGANTANINATLAAPDLLRQRLKTAYVYILSHEGKKDTGYSYPVSDTNSVITVGPPDMPAVGNVWTEAALVTQFGSDWRNYRWKVYSIEVNTRNLQ